ncbi:MSHA biogenesis protein MshI [Pseudoduganella danionis]|uniref:MSHA biogenesis protein MshI n=1 Tax=Pseudoduganella danionis TaxID=1890295 RepID=UPI0035B2972E
MSQQINLYNPAFEPQKNYATTPVVVGVLAATVLTLTCLTLLAKNQLAATTAQAQQVKAVLASREASKAAATAAFVAPRKSEALQQELELARSGLSNLQKVAGILEQGQAGGVRGYSPYLRALARRSSDGLWLTGVQIQGNGDSILLQGRTLKAALLPPYLASLSAESVLRGKKFAQLELHEPQAAASASASAAGAASAGAAPRFVEFSLQSAADEVAKAVQP